MRAGESGHIVTAARRSRHLASEPLRIRFTLPDFEISANLLVLIDNVLMCLCT